MAVKTFINRLSPALVLIIIFAGIVSCDTENSTRAILWTDRPEFAYYAEFFNTSQTQYKVEVRFFESPAQKLITPGEYPDIVVASWLNNSSTKATFKPLDNMFSKDAPEQSFFYSRLLASGKIDKNQYLLPVSFNIPAMVFARDFSQPPSNPFTIEMEEIKELGKAYNKENGAFFSRMGFSPSSNDDFLFLSAVLFGASFREASPIAWDPLALEQCITYIQQWITEANKSIHIEDDFAFKYFFDPPDKLLSSGRMLFMYMNSSAFFTLHEERRMNLDFRWLAAKEMIPIDEWTVYYGIHKKAKAKKAAEAFARWFFSAETQKLLMEEGKNKRLNETSFGIAGGFSAMKTVTEQIFPLFYPDLLGHIPPENYLSPPNILPRNWVVIKERVLVPYLKERIRHSSRDEVRPLERRISDWYRLNRE